MLAPNPSIINHGWQHSLAEDYGGGKSSQDENGNETDQTAEHTAAKAAPLLPRVFCGNAPVAEEKKGGCVDRGTMVRKRQTDPPPR